MSGGRYIILKGPILHYDFERRIWSIKVVQNSNKQWLRCKVPGYEELKALIDEENARMTPEERALYPDFFFEPMELLSDEELHILIDFYENHTPENLANLKQKYNAQAILSNSGTFDKISGITQAGIIPDI